VKIVPYAICHVQNGWLLVCTVSSGRLPGIYGLQGSFKKKSFFNRQSNIMFFKSETQICVLCDIFIACSAPKASNLPDLQRRANAPDEGGD